MQPVGSNWYNARARMDVEGRRVLYVESEGSSPCNARAQVNVQPSGSIARAQVNVRSGEQLAGSTMCNARARMNEQLDVQPVGSNWYNARARTDVQLDVQSVGSNRYNALARKDIKPAGSCLGKPRFVAGKSPGKRHFTLSKTITNYKCVEVSCL